MSEIEREFSELEIEKRREDMLKRMLNTPPTPHKPRKPHEGKISRRKLKRKHPNDDAFEAVAKRLECDEDKARFEEKLGKIARAKPQAPMK